jgi:plasmid stabilization system protein ParE
MTYQVLITWSAERDIREAVAWWRDNRSAAQAERWYEKIMPAIATLAENPYRCPIAPETDLLPTGLRQLHFGLSRKVTHRIVFTIIGSEVQVLRVWHVARQDLGLEDLVP